MFRASPDSSQTDLFSNVEQFPRARDQEKLNDPNAWQNVFLDQVVKRVPEERFAELFDDATGRPNAPLRLLVGMLILKEGFGWSDEELFEAIHFNLLVRRALGLMNLTDEVPVESTYYLFKRRLYRYQVETGSNLLKEVFQELTRDQAKRLGVVGERLRMDSTLLGSNLAACTRLQLVIGCLQAFWKSLTDEQKVGLSEADRALLDRLCAKRPSQHIYRLEETTKQTWLEALGQVLLRLHQADDLQSSPRYALIERLLLEQYQIDEAGEEPRVVLKPAQEISADSLQSPHDEDAAYRKKRDETVRGYSVNLTETCQEGLNLIVDVQVEPATAADNGYLKDAVQSSEQVLETAAQEISADGAYYSETNEAYAQEQDKEIYYTGFPGKPGQYDYERSDDGVVVIDRQSGERQLAEEYKPGRYRFRVDGKWRYITDKTIDAAACRRRTEALPREFFNRRCNVEASIFQLSYHTRKKNLKYRGRCAVQLWAVCRVAWINIKRIVIYQEKQAEMMA
ncbi:transposase [Thiorhodococcus mannitoliphagus]|uniref:Transposase n=1 Tax=Thiorhodococcus mannitoliphagus TaxID=329406 RepID=A0A6P1E5R8_9GAMM|nr:transposase [Thiorhodococcus mannitoliphagus]NEX23374.1 transposase [Thiorhodococcus mannitoliphagus]